MSSLEQLVEEYDYEHRDPANRVLNVLGVTLVGTSAVVLFIAPQAALLLFASGWTSQFVGRLIEGKKPKPHDDWRFLIAGAVWYGRQVTSLFHEGWQRADHE